MISYSIVNAAILPMGKCIFCCFIHGTAAADADQEPINLNVFSALKLNYTSVI